jgi:hypothetical protein
MTLTKQTVAKVSYQVPYLKSIEREKFEYWVGEVEFWWWMQKAGYI